MMIDVRACLELKGKVLALEHTYELPHLVDRNKQLISLSPVYFIGRGEMEAGLFTVKGIIKGEYTLACSRCLSEVHYTFEQEVDERFNIQQRQPAVNDLEDDEWDEIHPVHGQIIDLQPYIEEDILVSIPFIPACKSAEQCEANQLQEGTDWTILTEEKKKQQVDPRLAELAKFFDQNKG